MDQITELSPEQRARVRALATAAGAADGAAPLNEEARLLLDRPGATHWLIADPTGIVGYAQWQDANATGQLVVRPDRRRRGVGTALLGAVRAAHPDVALWAFGDSPAARAFAAARGLAPVRSLLVLARDLGDVAAPEPPPGIRLRGYTDADAAAFLAANAAAFAGHPEQGHFSADDLAARQAEDWWDPAGLLLALDADGVAGFHWTKRHDAHTGEVYVLGVHPRAAGRGLGGVLLQAGLAHLARGGLSRVILYVDAANAAAVRLYQRAGFARDHADTLYGHGTTEGGGP